MSGFTVEKFVCKMINNQRKIDFKFLADTLSYDWENRPAVNYDYDAHIKLIKRAIIDNDLVDYIEISGPNVEKEFIQESLDEYFTKCTIVVRNLDIRVDSFRCDQLILDRLEIDEKYPEKSIREADKYNGGIHIKFLNNNFTANDSDRNPYAKITLGENAYVSFESNTFKGTDLYFGLSPLRSILVLRNNAFLNRHVTIGGWERTPTASHVAWGWVLQGSDIERYAAVKRFEEKLEERNDASFSALRQTLTAKLKEGEDGNINDVLDFLLRYEEKPKVDAKDLVRKSNTLKAIVRLTDNQFTQLKPLSGIHYFFRGVNKIEQLVADAPPEYFYWGQYQQLDAKGRFAHAHKQFFMQLKANAIERYDGFQELILKREIAKCESHLLKEEKSYLKSFQDRAVLFIGWFFSDYGASWIRPLTILFAVNIIIVLLVHSGYFFSKPHPHCWFVFWELFNPISSLAETIGDAAKKSSLITVVNTFQKIIFAGAAYEIIKAFRRFSGK
ncbi:hypothetical protein KFE96_03050 [Kordiimonas sp. SCSIO 12603]|uniref:hypothetical protein n=1 Tax=Kordiimonas sp. SCSIO 12603 TaxID=2829596 RepID=UPI0021062C80|nr:hypothetical protein [Kordiimonas sp. SCSIO 12603]UTW59301.1 hypothetical protein KFE96_03050 [Kordiimonas sp. SCSIO 12603]